MKFQFWRSQITLVGEVKWKTTWKNSDGLSSSIQESVKDYTSTKDLWFKLEEEYQKKNQDKENEAKFKDEKQEEKQVQDSDTSEVKYSSMDDNSECTDDEVLTEDEEKVQLKANNAFTSTMSYIDLRSNPRLKNKMLRSFEKYKEETKTLLMS